MMCDIFTSISNGDFMKKLKLNYKNDKTFIDSLEMFILNYRLRNLRVYCR